MPYIGSDPSNRFVAPKAASVFSGDGSTTAFTLDHAVGSDEDILVSVDGVIQEPSVAYAVSSGTTLTFTAAPSSNSGNNIFVYYLFRTVATVDHPSTSSLQATSGTFTGTLDVTGASTLTGALSAKGGVVFNEDGADVNFRVEGNTDTELLKVDAGEDNVKIGTGAGNYAILSIRNENAGAQERGLYIELAPASGTSPNNVAVFSAVNSNMTQPVVRIHHESPAADGKLLTCTVTGSNTETFYLDEDGDAYIKGNVGIRQAPNNSALSVTETGGNETVANFTNNAGSGPYGIYVDFSSGAPDNNSNYAFRFEDSSTDRCIIYSDGDIYNHDGTFAQMSDERIKDNITDAKSQWDDIKAMRFVNYQRKDDILQYGKEDAKVQLGLIGQEVEKVSPNIVRQVEPNASDVRHSSELGTLYEKGDDIPEDKQVGDIKEVKDKVKGVAYSILYMKAVKCLQEAITKIEILETENATKETQIADLISRVTALESK